jgi:hypothetical protein
MAKHADWVLVDFASEQYLNEGKARKMVVTMAQVKPDDALFANIVIRYLL